MLSRVYFLQKFFGSLGKTLQRGQGPIFEIEEIFPKPQYPSTREKNTIQTTDSTVSYGHNSYPKQPLHYGA